MKILKLFISIFLSFVILHSMISVVLCTTNSNHIEMCDMHVDASSHYNILSDSITDSYGKTYESNIVCLDASLDAYVTFDLNGNYKSFQGNLVASSGTGSGALMNIAIFADGEEKYSFQGFSRQTESQPIEFDTSGVRTLSIKTSNEGSYSCGWIFLVDSTFEKMNYTVACNEYATLSDVVVIDSNAYSSDITLMKDSFGEFHDGSKRFDASNAAFALYNLKGEYTTFSCLVVTSPATGSGASINIEFFCDDDSAPPILSFSGITKQTDPIPVCIDVNNVKKLFIKTTNEGAYSNGVLFVVDDILTEHVHKLGDWIVEKSASCTESGQKKRYCTECNQTCSIESVPATGHRLDAEWITTQEATCNRRGEETCFCSICGEGITRSIEMFDHIENSEWEITVDANCVQSGKRVKRCIRCGTVLETEAVPKLSHFFSEWTMADNNPSVEERICNICGAIETRENLEKSVMPENSNMLFTLLLSIATSVNHIVFYRNRNKNKKKFIYISNVATHYMIILLFFTFAGKVSVLNLLMFIGLPIILIFTPESLLLKLFTYLGALGVSAVAVIEIWHNLDWYLLPLMIEYIGFVFVIKVKHNGN